MSTTAHKFCPGSCAELLLRVQRHALVADILEQSQAQKVIDLGCGEGKLLEHFIRSASCSSAQTLVSPFCHRRGITQHV